MKNFNLFLILLIFNTAQSQQSVEARFLKKTKVDWEYFVGVDPFDAFYFIDNETLYKNQKNKIQSYSNLQLGKIDHVQVFNALKIVVVHKPQNTVVLLDNRLAELIEINFNIISPYRLVNNVALGSDSTFWIFNALTLQLELFDYETGKSKLNTIPLDDRVLVIDSDYNNVYALTPSYLYQFNYTGSLISKIKHDTFEDFKIVNGFFLFRKNNKIYYKSPNDNEFQTLEIPKKLIKQFFVMNQTLYIYDGEFLYHYQFIKD
jgi:hypothetical protein